MHVLSKLGDFRHAVCSCCHNTFPSKPDLHAAANAGPCEAKTKKREKRANEKVRACVRNLCNLVKLTSCPGFALQSDTEQTRVPSSVFRVF